MGNFGLMLLRYNVMFIDMFYVFILLNIIKIRDVIDCGYNMYILRWICILMLIFF